MTGRSDAQAVLFTGVYGTGKTSMVEEIADIMEERGLRYGAIDLDWLGWFDPGFGDHDAGRPVMFRNLDAVVGNYYSTGVRRFAVAGALATTDALTDLRGALSMPVTVVRLTVPIEEIERRLGSAITAGRKDDLRVAKEWIAANRGEEVADLVVVNDGPIREIARGVVSDLGWFEEHERRWDSDERGEGIAPGGAFGPNVDELRQAMRGESWVAEDADAHLMPHIRAACDAEGSHVAVLDATVIDAVLVVDLRWVGREPAGPDAVRAEVFRLVGSFAEHTTHVAQHSVEQHVEFEIATGTTSAESPFLPHGHLVRIRFTDPR
jgi:hypothetical protein